MLNYEKPEDNGDDRGGLPMRQQERMLMRSIRENWGLEKPEDRPGAAAISVLAYIADQGSTERNRLSASKSLASIQRHLDNCQLDVEKRSDVGPEFSVTIVNEMKSLMELASQDIAYGDLRRAAAIGHSHVSGTNGPNGEQRPLADGGPPLADGPRGTGTPDG
jgi:hypothetical protein